MLDLATAAWHVVPIHLFISSRVRSAGKVNEKQAGSLIPAIAFQKHCGVLALTCQPLPCLGDPGGADSSLFLLSFSGGL